MVVTKEVTTANVVKTPSKFEGGPIFAGTVSAIALSVILVQFGAIVGLSADMPLRGEGSIAAWGVIAAGGWILWVQLISALLGGYITGRLRSSTLQYTAHENEMRDGMYGLVTWATCTILVFLAMSAASAVAGFMALEDGNPNTVDALTDPEKNSAIIFAFIHGSVSLMAAAASWWAATVGGDHRDGEYDFSAAWSFKK